MAAHGSPSARRSGTVKRLKSLGSVSAGELRPGHRRGDGCAGQRPQGVGRGDGAVAAVLVEVDEDALAPLLLPPRGGDPVVALLQLAAEADRGVPDVAELPVGPDPHVDVHAAVARRLRVADQPELLQQLARHPGHAHRVGEGGARLRVEVDAQLVGSVDVVATDGPGVEGQRAHVRAPHRHRDLGRADLLGGAPGREGDLHRLQVVGSPLGHPLLVERVGVAVLRTGGEPHALPHPGGPPLQRRRAVAQRPHEPVLHGREVLRHHQLGDLGRLVGGLVDHPVGARHAHRPVPGDHLGCGWLRHAATLEPIPVIEVRGRSPPSLETIATSPRPQAGCAVARLAALAPQPAERPSSDLSGALP